MSVYKRGDGLWQVLVDVDRGADGKRRRRALGTYPTRKKAEVAERDALSTRDRGVDLAPGTVTLAGLLDRYVQDRSALGRGEKTVEEYRRLVDLYVRPNVGALTLARLRPAHIAEWLTTIIARGGRNGDPISAKTARHAYALVNAGLRWGVRMELVGRNVRDAMTAPTPGRTEARALASDELRRLTEAANGTRWANFLEIALGMGMRRGELLALTWDAINFETGHVEVRASIAQTSKGVSLKSTKSGRVRVIPLTKSAMASLRHQRVLQAQDRLRAGSAYGASDAVFTNEVGERLTPKAATNGFARLAKRAGLSVTSLHSTRHTAGTLMIASGVGVVETAKVLGHTDGTTTLRIYAHAVEGGDRIAVDVLEQRLALARRPA